MTTTLGDGISEFFRGSEKLRKYADLYEAGRKEAEKGVPPLHSTATEDEAAQELATRQKVLDMAFRDAGVPERYRRASLRSFVDYCEIRAIPLEPGKAPALRLARDLIKEGRVNERPGLLLHGQTGTGKTGILSSVFNALVAQGQTGLWIQYNAFIDTLQDGYSDGSYLARLRSAQKANIILLDDFGDPARVGEDTETFNRQELMFKLINDRYNRSHEDGPITLVSSNLTPNQLAEQFGERTAERLFETCAVQEVWGHSLRFDNLAGD